MLSGKSLRPRRVISFLTDRIRVHSYVGLIFGNGITDILNRPSC